MRAAVKTSAIVSLAGLAFALGATTAVVRGWGGGYVRARLVNDSNPPVQSFKVRFSSCGTKAEVGGGPIAPGKSQTVRFVVCGEGAYHVEAVLENGSTLKGDEAYVESGYSTVDTITPKGIASTQSTYAL